MATLKHIASKNSDYSAAETYLVYQHDEFSGKKILDEQSRPKLRESYILDTLECGEASFAMACLLPVMWAVKLGKAPCRLQSVRFAWVFPSRHNRRFYQSSIPLLYEHS